jgi:hypothetical protein
MALPSFYTKPKDEGELDKRKELASMVKSLAATRSDFSPQELQAEGKSLSAEGEKLGVSRNQLSNLYNQYKAEGVKSTPLGGTPELAEPPAPAGSPAQTPAGEPTKPSMFASMPSTPTTPASTPLAGQQPQDNSKKWAEGTFRGLEDYAKMQNEPMGASSSLNQRRSLESEGGKAMRMARKLQRQGFGNAAEKMALDAAQLKMGEPAIKTEEYRRKESDMANLAKQGQAETDERSRRLLQMQDRMIAMANKEMDEGRMPSFWNAQKS